MTGIKAYAPSLDTLGFFAREANDLALIRAAYGHAPEDTLKAPPRIGLVQLPWADLSEPYNTRNLQEAARALRAAGARVRAWEAPETWSGLLQAQHRIMTREATRSFRGERERFARLFSPSLQAVMAEGDVVSAKQYADAKKRKRAALAQLEEAWQRFDLLLAPAAKGEAPSGLGNTGDPVFNRSWTLLGTPCIALPFNVGPFGLPLSVQLVGRPGSDDRLIAAARWVEKVLS
jgi:Asp-tRNA(Asn)/Glu-tRNA(Gln) amidotransferase A subunit family amidase